MSVYYWYLRCNCTLIEHLHTDRWQEETEKRKEITLHGWFLLAMKTPALLTMGMRLVSINTLLCLLPIYSLHSFRHYIIRRECQGVFRQTFDSVMQPVSWKSTVRPTPSYTARSPNTSRSNIHIRNGWMTGLEVSERLIGDQ